MQTLQYLLLGMLLHKLLLLVWLYPYTFKGTKEVQIQSGRQTVLKIGYFEAKYLIDLQ